MNLRKIVIGSFLLVYSFICAAQQVKIKEVPIKDIDAASGEKMYMAYCAACHGTDGKGAGPAATALKTPPTDLTYLAKKNDGKFPGSDVYQIILGEVTLPAAHGSKEMPVWSGMFASLCGTGSSKNMVAMRAGNITDYLKTLQR